MNLRRTRRECPRFINLTALIDVVFNLLLFFMVTTSFNHNTELSIDLPKAEAAQKQAPEPSIEFAIDSRGKYYLNGHALQSETAEEVRAALQTAQTEATNAQAGPDKSEPSLVIEAGSATPYQSVITVLDAAQQLGLKKIRFANQSLVHRSAGDP